MRLMQDVITTSLHPTVQDGKKKIIKKMPRNKTQGR